MGRGFMVVVSPHRNYRNTFRAPQILPQTALCGAAVFNFGVRDVLVSVVGREVFGSPLWDCLVVHPPSNKSGVVVLVQRYQLCW